MAVKAKIAEIISEYEVAFTAGSGQKVLEGDIATVYRGIEVRDPDTDESLGTVNRPLIRLEIVEVQPHLSVGQAFDRVEPASSQSVTMFRFFGEVGARKRITADPTKEDWRTVLLQVGQEATIDRPQASEST